MLRLFTLPEKPPAFPDALIAMKSCKGSNGHKGTCAVTCRDARKHLIEMRFLASDRILLHEPAVFNHLRKEAARDAPKQATSVGVDCAKEQREIGGGVLVRCDCGACEKEFSLSPSKMSVAAVAVTE